MKLISKKNQCFCTNDELGKGGEGSVYSLKNNPQLVAKVLHGEDRLRTKPKLEKLINSSNKQLSLITAWPIDILRLENKPNSIGFLMQRIPENRSPIHRVSSPRPRKKYFPNETWYFCLQVARNLAHGLHHLHESDIVVGDINDTNIYVSEHAEIIFIDCDSFQVGGFPCKVGVPNFTPPELQKVNFGSGFIRTKNHDNFGLAVLIFQLLFSGRHPFSGIPISKTVTNEIPDNILCNRYIFADDILSRGLKPPPNKEPANIVPRGLQRLFKHAFLTSHKHHRPTAQQWCDALQECMKNLISCSNYSGHVFHRSLVSCPWCHLAKKKYRPFPKNGKPPPFSYETWSRVLRSPYEATRIGPNRTETLATLNSLKFLLKANLQKSHLTEAFKKIDGVISCQRSSTLKDRIHIFLAELREIDSKYQLALRRKPTQKYLQKAAELKLRKNALIKFHVGTDKHLLATDKQRQLLQGYGFWNARDIEKDRLSAIAALDDSFIQSALHWKEACVSKSKPNLSCLTAEISSLAKGYQLELNKLQHTMQIKQKQFEEVTHLYLTSVQRHRSQSRKLSKDFSEWVNSRILLTKNLKKKPKQSTRQHEDCTALLNHPTKKVVSSRPAKVHLPTSHTEESGGISDKKRSDFRQQLPLFMTALCLFGLYLAQYMLQ